MSKPASGPSGRTYEAQLPAAPRLQVSASQPAADRSQPVEHKPLPVSQPQEQAVRRLIDFFRSE